VAKVNLNEWAQKNPATKASTQSGQNTQVHTKPSSEDSAAHTNQLESSLNQLESVPNQLDSILSQLDPVLSLRQVRT
jgi:hypothetical protein